MTIGIWVSISIFGTFIGIVLNFLDLQRLFLHSKNTCVAHTQGCVLQNTTLLSYMKDTRLFWLDTITCVGKDNTSLVWYMFQHTKNQSTANEKRTHDLMHHRQVSYPLSYHWQFLQGHYCHIYSYFDNYAYYD